MNRIAGDRATVSWSHPGATSYSVWLTRPEWGGSLEYSIDPSNPRTLFGLVSSSSYGTFVTAKCGTVVSAPSQTATIPAWPGA